MDQDYEGTARRVPSLVTLCQRAAMAHVDGISCLGNDLTYQLVKPILEKCSIQHLQRLEEASPHLYNDTGEIWRDLCYRKFCLFAGERYSIDDQPQEPDSWRSRYFALEIVEAQRMEDAASKLRSKRVAGDELKKEKAVKYTDRLPPPKRAKTTSGGNYQAKTLFQKARIDATKRHMALTTRLLPPAPPSRNFRVLPPNPRTTLLSPSPSATPSSHASSSRVTVKTVMHRRSTASSSTSASSTAVSSSNLNRQSHNDRVLGLPTPRNSTTSHTPFPSATTQTRNTTPTTSTIPPTSKPEGSHPRPIMRSPAKKKQDPMSIMFVPKRPPKVLPTAQRPT